MNKIRAVLMIIGLWTVFGCSSKSDISSSAASLEVKTVLIIGDSISLGYGEFVGESLAAKFVVRGPGTNARNTTFTLENIDAWLARHPNNDIITWNNGIWNATTGHKTSTDQYRTDLITIARKLKATGSRIVFFTTTPLLPEAAPYKNPDLIPEFNAIAKAVLPGEGVEVWDLNSYSSGLQYIDGTHFDRAGYKYLASIVSMAILYQPSVVTTFD